MAKPDPETHYLVAALAVGVAADIVPWDAPVDWAAWPLVVVRTLGHFRRLPWFLALGRGVPAAWPASSIPHRRDPWPGTATARGYLRGLAEAGIATVPPCGWTTAAVTPRPAGRRGWGRWWETGGVDRRHRRAPPAASDDPACLEHLDRLVAERM